MVIEYIAALAAAFCFAGVGLILRKLSRGRLGKWTVPVMAASGMMLVSVYLEYDWFSRVSKKLPQGVVVVFQNTESMALRPWTYIWPITTSFIAADTRSVGYAIEDANLITVTLYNFSKRQDTRPAQAILDCKERLQVLLTDDVQSEGEIIWEKLTWLKTPADDPLLKTLCNLK